MIINNNYNSYIYKDKDGMYVYQESIGANGFARSFTNYAYDNEQMQELLSTDGIKQGVTNAAALASNVSLLVAKIGATIAAPASIIATAPMIINNAINTTKLSKQLFADAKAVKTAVKTGQTGINFTDGRVISAIARDLRQISNLNKELNNALKLYQNPEETKKSMQNKYSNGSAMGDEDKVLLSVLEDKTKTSNAIKLIQATIQKNTENYNNLNEIFEEAKAEARKQMEAQKKYADNSTDRIKSADFQQYVRDNMISERKKKDGSVIRKVQASQKSIPSEEAIQDEINRVGEDLRNSTSLSDLQQSGELAGNVSGNIQQQEKSVKASPAVKPQMSREELLQQQAAARKEYENNELNNKQQVAARAQETKDRILQAKKEREKEINMANSGRAKQFLYRQGNRIKNTFNRRRKPNTTKSGHRVVTARLNPLQLQQRAEQQAANNQKQRAINLANMKQRLSNSNIANRLRGLFK